MMEATISILDDGGILLASSKARFGLIGGEVSGCGSVVYYGNVRDVWFESIEAYGIATNFTVSSGDDVNTKGDIVSPVEIKDGITPVFNRGQIRLKAA